MGYGLWSSSKYVLIPTITMSGRLTILIFLSLPGGLWETSRSLHMLAWWNREVWFSSFLHRWYKTGFQGVFAFSSAFFAGNPIWSNATTSNNIDHLLPYVAKFLLYLLCCAALINLTSVDHQHGLSILIEILAMHKISCVVAELQLLSFLRY